MNYLFISAGICGNQRHAREHVIESGGKNLHTTFKIAISAATDIGASFKFSAKITFAPSSFNHPSEWSVGSRTDNHFKKLVYLGSWA